MRTNNYSIARMLFLLILAAVMPSMAMAEDTYIVAGNYAEIFGTGWDGNNETTTKWNGMLPLVSTKRLIMPLRQPVEFS